MSQAVPEKKQGYDKAMRRLITDMRNWLESGVAGGAGILAVSISNFEWPKTRGSKYRLLTEAAEIAGNVSLRALTFYLMAGLPTVPLVEEAGKFANKANRLSKGRIRQHTKLPKPRRRKRVNRKESAKP